MSRRIAFVRHAQVAQPHAGRYIGKTDVPLGEQGERQATDLAPLVDWLAPDLCVTSPLLRARQTASLALGEMWRDGGEWRTEVAGAGAGSARAPARGQIAWRVDDDLAEIDFGDWEGKSFDEIVAEVPRLVDQWADCEQEFQFPQGESVRGFHRRVAAAAARLAAMPQDVVIVFAHGGVIRSALCTLLNVDVNRHWIFNVPHASVTLLERTGDRWIAKPMET